jgi:hypothetical protein
MGSHRSPKGLPLSNVRYGSAADIALGPRHCRFTPKADIAGRHLDVRFVPIDGVIGRRLVDS